MNDLTKFVEETIREYHTETAEGYQLEVEKLDANTQNEFAIKLIEADDRDLTFLLEGDKYDNLIKVLYDMFKKEDIDSKIHFADSVRNVIVDHYKLDMQVQVDDLIGYVESEDMEDRGMKKIINSTNGESRWVRA